MDGVSAFALTVVALVGVVALSRFVRSLGDVFALARGGHDHRLRALLESDPSAAKAKDAKGETPLHHAAKHGEIEAMKLLLASGADKDAKTPLGVTPLHVARAFGEARAEKLLLEAGAKDEKTLDVPDGDPEMMRAATLARAKIGTLRELHAANADTTFVRIDGEWRKVDDLDEDIETLTDWKVELPDGTVRGGFSHAVAFARAKKDADGALPPALANEEKRFVDHVTE